jgi:DNA-binding HxlR family transcriptional regulator
MGDVIVFGANCPSRIILDQIADKWSVLAMAVLSEPRRFNAIKRSLEGITQRALTQTLRRLERNGLVSRSVIGGRPVGVEYATTKLGRSLRQPFMALYGWTVSNMDTIVRAQSRFDRDAARGERSPVATNRRDVTRPR